MGMMDRHDQQPASDDVHLPGSRFSLLQGISHSTAQYNSGRNLASQDGQHDDHESVGKQTPMDVDQDAKKRSNITFAGVPHVDKVSTPVRRGSTLRMK